MDAYDYAAGFPGMERVRVNGADFSASYFAMRDAIQFVRENSRPLIIQADVPLLGHHTSGVRKEFYRSAEDLALHASKDPVPMLRHALLQAGVTEEIILQIERETEKEIAHDFHQAMLAPEPDPSTVGDFVFAPTPVMDEEGIREPAGAEKILMVDATVFAIREIMEDYPEAVVYGQDVGRRLGGQHRHPGSLYYWQHNRPECYRREAHC
jgi:2-oxoisovalerate dehydrogenase E1 component